jgi:WD40 repeat protein
MLSAERMNNFLPPIHRLTHLLGLLAALTLLSLSTKSFGQDSQNLLWMYSPLTYATTCAYSPNGTKLVIAGYKGVQIFDASSGSFLTSLPTLYPSVNSVVFSPDGNTLAVGGSTLTSGLTPIEFWDVRDLTLTRTVYADVGSVNSLAFSPDGKTLVDGGSSYGSPLQSVGHPVQAWDVASGNLMANLSTTAKNVTSVQFAGNGESLVVGGSTQYTPVVGIVEIFNTSTFSINQTFATACATVYSVALSPNGETLAVGGNSVDTKTDSDVGVLELWNVGTSKLTNSLNTSSEFVIAVGFSPDGKTLADGTFIQYLRTGLLQLWNVSTGKLLGNLNAATKNAVQTLAFAPNGKSLAECEWAEDPVTFNVSTNANIWNLSTQKLTATLNTNLYTGSAATLFSEDGKTLISAGGGINPGTGYSFYGDFLFSNPTTGKIKETVSATNEIWDMALSPDGKIIADCAVGASDGTLELRDAASGKLIRILSTVQGNFTHYQKIAYSPDGSLIAAGITSESSTGYVSYAVQIWNVATGKLISSLATAADNQVLSLSFSPDGSKLAIAGTGYSNGYWVGVMEVWNPRSGAFISTLYPNIFNINSAKFSQDGNYLAIGGIKYLPGLQATTGGMELWDATTLTRIAVLSLPTTVNAVNTTAFSKDSQIVYAGTDGGLCSFSTANNLLLEDAAYGSISTLALSPDGTMISYTASEPLQGVLQSPVTSVKLSSNGVIGGQSATATLTLIHPAPPGGQVVSLASSISSLLVPISVTVAQGHTSASFTIETIPVGSDQQALVSARIGGFSQSATIAVNAPVIKSLTLKPSSVKGGSSSTATVTIGSAAPVGGLVFTLSSNNPAATVPQTVTIPAGKSTATFVIETEAVATKKQVVISAKVGSASAVATLTVS